MIIGFTSGRYKSESYFINKLNYLLDIGTNAIELHPRMDALDDFDLSHKSIDLLNNKFEYVSLHAPANDFRIDGSDTSERILNKIENLTTKINIKNIVIHPDIVNDFSVLKNKDWPISLENMDIQKKDGRYVQELDKIFEKIPSANLVLDLNHCYTHDTDMNLANDIINKFRSRIVQCHISAYLGPDKLHEPLSGGACDIILDRVFDKNIPLIIEVTTDTLSIKDLKKELNYIKDRLQK